jgi:uncharacterized protein YndB with AHSA1/START domain
MQNPGSSGRRDTASLVVPANTDMAYRALADPEALMAWLPPGGMSGRALEYDFREGGRYRLELTYDASAPSGAGKTTEYTDISAGRFVSLEPGSRIAYTVEFESTDLSFAGEMLMTWTFEEAPAGARVTITADNVPPGIGKADHDAGLRASLENLARFLGDRDACARAVVTGGEE